MNIERRYHSKPELRDELAEQERSAAWLARKVGVSQQLMSFVLRNERTIAESKARLAAAVLGGKTLDSFFAPIVTDMSEAESERTEQIA